MEPESNSDRNKTLSIEVYLNRVWPYLKDIINNLKNLICGTFNQQQKRNFISSKDNNEERIMHSKSNNIEFMIYDNVDEVFEELFESPFIDKRCQKNNQK